ncbi:hypothetical protein PU629_07355 [Pullulanibacillus sp. KACC 23026]|uniref:hypothetical protein n=1 Tax=Pullulanibacillus sp. KACC 23026 TaxID=3028315 RepID=UPI0023B163E9|nr:hypothetical protein [Pullulanibacillus sp. KACC 23026]WEG14174.1 hypothetical protein PU629_07355 [Pullulanibacillus sp. KACC 23026]
MRYKTLDEARKAYLNKKLTPEQFNSYLKKFAYVDQERKSIDKSMKRIEKRLIHA